MPSSCNQMNQRTPSPVQPVSTEQQRMEQPLASNCGFGVIARLFDTLSCGAPPLDRRLRAVSRRQSPLSRKLIRVTENRHAQQCAGRIVVTETACDFVPRHNQIVSTTA